MSRLPRVPAPALAVLTLLTAAPTAAQSADCGCTTEPGHPSPGLGRVVAEALDANLALRDAALAAEAARAAHRTARARFLPSLALDARYTRADGGRLIEIPVGDLVNPVYATLNELTGADRFTPIANQITPFLRPREQETRLRATQLVWAPSASAEARRRARDVAAAGASVEIERQRLRLEVTRAWYGWLDALRGAEIQRDALALAREYERTAERRLAEALTTPDVPARARAERLEIEEAHARAEAAVLDARARVNLLRNADLDAPLPEPGPPPSLTPILAAVDTAEDLSSRTTLLDERPELRRLDHAADALDATADARRGGHRPWISLAVDVGIQGERYGLGPEDRFVTGSVVVSWPVLDRSVSADVERVRVEARRIRTRRTEARAAYRFEMDAAERAFRVALQGVARADARLVEAERVHRLVERRGEEGLATPLELLDARTTLTRARLARASSRTDVLVRLAELRHAAGLDPHLPLLPGASP